MTCGTLTHVYGSTGASTQLAVAKCNSGHLPFTGIDLFTILLIALGVVLIGASMRRLTR